MIIANLEFHNNANTIAYLEARVKASTHWMNTITDCGKTDFSKEVNHFQAELDIELAKREEMMKTVPVEAVQLHIDEGLAEAKKHKTHAYLIMSHLEFYIDWIKNKKI